MFNEKVYLIIFGNIYLIGLAQLDAVASGKMGARALCYYCVTTFMAVIIGISSVLIIHPGNPKIKGELGEGFENKKVSTLDAFFDLSRQVYAWLID